MFLPILLLSSLNAVITPIIKEYIVESNGMMKLAKTPIFNGYQMKFWEKLGWAEMYIKVISISFFDFNIRMIFSQLNITKEVIK